MAGSMLQFQKVLRNKGIVMCTGTYLHRDYSMSANTNAGSAGITIPKNKIVLAKQ